MSEAPHEATPNRRPRSMANRPPDPRSAMRRLLWALVGTVAFIVLVLFFNLR